MRISEPPSTGRRSTTPFSDSSSPVLWSRFGARTHRRRAFAASRTCLNEQWTCPHDSARSRCATSRAPRTRSGTSTWPCRPTKRASSSSSRSETPAVLPRSARGSHTSRGANRDHDEALRLVDMSEGDARGRFPLIEAQNAMLLAQIALVENRLDDAEQFAMRATQLIRRVGWSWQEAYALNTQLSIALQRGDVDTALESGRLALAINVAAEHAVPTMRGNMIGLASAALAGAHLDPGRHPVGCSRPVQDRRVRTDHPRSRRDTRERVPAGVPRGDGARPGARRVGRRGDRARRARAASDRAVEREHDAYE